jgi:hypothetical protein
MKSYAITKTVLLASALMHAQVNGAFALGLEDLTPHVNDTKQLLADLKTITTPQQAQAYVGVLTPRMPKIQAQHRRMLAAGPEMAKLHAAGKHTPSIKAAHSTVQILNNRLYPQLDAEMHRVQALNPALKPHFEAIRNLNP